jgi:hypothetical protein
MTTMAEQWHLKKYDDGSVFGPVDLPTLQQWASKGEISPYDMISRDTVKWMAAPELDDLEMKWVVDFPDGEAYGPTCLEAIRSFVEDGQLTAENALRNMATGERYTIGEHPAFQDLTGNADSGNGEAEAPAAEVSSGEDVEYLHSRIGELEETVEKMQAAHETTMSQLNQDLVTAKTQAQFLRSELDLLKEASKAEQDAKSATEQEVQTELTRIREQFNILFEINKQLTENYEQSLSQLHRKIEDTIVKIEENAQREAELNNEVAEAAQREAHYRGQIIAMEKEVVKAEQSQANLLKKYAELNDRLMKFLNESAER